MHMLYWALTAVIAVVVALDLQWWLARFSGGWKGGDVKQMARLWTLWLGVAGAILRGGVFYILPTVVLRGLGRGYTWELGFSMAPTVILFIGWNVLMGVSKFVARVLMVLRR